MRILVISNLYPPYAIGGYEMGCFSVVEALKKRGHEIKVLTSTYGVISPESDIGIYRELKLNIYWKKQNRIIKILKLIPDEIYNQRVFKKLCSDFDPEIIYFWNLSGLSMSLVFSAQKNKLPVCYYVFDEWLSEWQKTSPGLVRFICKELFYLFLKTLHLQLPSGKLDLNYAQFASKYLKKTTLQIESTDNDEQILPWGLDIKSYPYKEISSNPKSLLYAGQLVPHKGVHTAVEALKIITQKQMYKSTVLTIVGGAVIPEYKTYLIKLINDLGLEKNVRFGGSVKRESLPSIYREHDILIFPSIWNEPFGITLLEAMSSGLAIVGTGTGGSAEIIKDNVNALIFEKENAEACADRIMRLMKDSVLFETLRKNGRETVEKYFSIDKMIDKIEDSLNRVVESNR